MKSTAQKIAADQYGKRGKLTYLEAVNGRHLFGFVDNNEVATVEEPFYIAITEAGESIELPAPMIHDEVYDQSEFAFIEARHKFFERGGFFE